MVPVTYCCYRNICQLCVIFEVAFNDMSIKYFMKVRDFALDQQPEDELA